MHSMYLLEMRALLLRKAQLGSNCIEFPSEICNKQMMCAIMCEFLISFTVCDRRMHHECDCLSETAQ